jgi:plasmid stabilization system protein ParE
LNRPVRQLRIASNAARDLAERAEYLRVEGSLSVARDFLTSITHTMELLRATPGIGKAFRVRLRPQIEFRRITVSRPFGRWLLVYTYSETIVRIERIIHSAQDFRQFFR